jgi:hypothetical protein
MEGEYEAEYEMEGEYEMEATPAAAGQQALAEFMAAVASQARTESEAEAMVGAAAVTSISAADRAALRRVLPSMVRGTAVLTRILRRRGVTRPAVRAVPTIMRRASRQLVRRAAAGQPVTRRAAARAMANQTRRVLGNPRTCAAAIQRNLRGTHAAARTVSRPGPRPAGRPVRRPAGPARPYAGGRPRTPGRRPY